MIHDAQSQRIVGTHDRQIDFVTHRMVAKGVQSVRSHREIRDRVSRPEDDSGGAGISRGTDQLGDMRRFCELPDKSVLATSRPNDKNLHPSAQSTSPELPEEADFRIRSLAT